MLVPLLLSSVYSKIRGVGRAKDEVWLSSDMFAAHTGERVPKLVGPKLITVDDATIAVVTNPRLVFWGWFLGRNGSVIEPMELIDGTSTMGLPSIWSSRPASCWSVCKAYSLLRL